MNQDKVEELIGRLPKAKRALLALLVVFDARYISRKEAIARGLGAEFASARLAGLVQPAGFECSVPADDWLETPEAIAALKALREATQ